MKSNQHIPEMYSTIQEVEAHLEALVGGKMAASREANKCDANASNDHKLDNYKPPHLFLHFDVNETILIGDPAGGDSVDDCLNKVIAKNAFVSTVGFGKDQTELSSDSNRASLSRSPSSGNISEESTHHFRPTNWWTGLPLNTVEDEPTNQSGERLYPPPLYTGWVWPPNTCPYYRTQYKKIAKAFTESSHGKIYRPLYEKIRAKLGLATNHATQSEDEDEFQHFLPAFFHTLQYYFPSHKINGSPHKPSNLPPPPKVTLVLRTFGQDLPKVARVITEFAQGNHPKYPNYYNPELILEEKQLYRGGWRYCCSDSTDRNESGEYDLLYELHPYNGGGIDCSGDDEVLDFLQSTTIVGIQDNYSFWRDHNHAPWSGKPVWAWTSSPDLDGDNPHHHHHILLDDNIHNDFSDGAGGIRVPIPSANKNKVSSLSYLSLHGKEALGMHGKHLIRVPTIRPLMEDDWFIRQIEEARLRLLLDDSASRGS
jgi:hypothetical protein